VATKCTVCLHPKLPSIELGLVYKTPLRVLANKYNLSIQALHRHRHAHLSPAVAAAILSGRKSTEIDLEALRVSESEGLLAQLVTQRGRLHVESELAARMGNVAGMVSCERAITSNLELLGKLLSMFTTHHEVRHTSVLISADYLALRQALIEALRPFPEAALAVGRALHLLESSAAKDITAAASKRPLMIEAEAIQ
jgi:hypothetical protein